MTSALDLERKIENIKEKTGVSLNIDRWRPGDGWTRNQLFVEGEDGVLTHQVSEVMSTKEMDRYLEGFIEINRAVEMDQEEE